MTALQCTCQRFHRAGSSTDAPNHASKVNLLCESSEQNYFLQAEKKEKTLVTGHLLRLLVCKAIENKH